MAQEPRLSARILQPRTWFYLQHSSKTLLVELLFSSTLIFTFVSTRTIFITMLQHHGASSLRSFTEPRFRHRSGLLPPGGPRKTPHLPGGNMRHLIPLITAFSLDIQSTLTHSSTICMYLEVGAASQGWRSFTW